MSSAQELSAERPVANRPRSSELMCEGGDEESTLGAGSAADGDGGSAANGTGASGRFIAASTETLDGVDVPAGRRSATVQPDDDPLGVGSLGDGSPAAPPSPSEKLCCALHGRYRTRRNLRQIPGTREWCCFSEEPCLLPGQSRSSMRNEAAAPSRLATVRGESHPSPPRLTQSENTAIGRCRRWEPSHWSPSRSLASSASPLRGRPVRLAAASRRGRRSAEDASHSCSAAGSPRSHEQSELAPRSLDAVSNQQQIALREGPGANEELVLCTLHNKWRHPDRMARKGNGEWVCTGEDKCKVADGRGQGTASSVGNKRRATGAAPTAGPPAHAARARSSQLRGRGLELAPRALSAASQGSSRSRSASGSGLSAFASRGNRQGARKVRGRRRKAQVAAAPLAGDDRGVPLPPGMCQCEVHQRPRFKERLVEKRPGYWVCKSTDRCKNADEVKCSLHGRWRTPQNMERGRGHDDWVCKSDCQCR